MDRMFAVEVRDHVMIAHSLPGEVFGPARQLHGATYVVDAAFFASALDGDGLVVDIGLATELLAEVLAPLKYRNLDTLPEMAGRTTTTEFVAKFVFDRIQEAIAVGRLGPPRVERLRVKLSESHLARAWYEAAL